MPPKRLKIDPSLLRNSLLEVKSSNDFTWDQLAKSINVSERTIRDWADGKFTIPQDKALQLERKFRIKILAEAKTLDAYWYIKKGARKGALARLKLYGVPGNRETRMKGGLISQQKRKANPGRYRLLGCNVRKRSITLKYSARLAELCGIILGDGGITDYQVRVTLNKNTDADYSFFVTQLFQKVFKEKPSVNDHENVLNVTLSSISYVEALEKIGIYRGNKVKRQASIPVWILVNRNFSRACLRGLMDTDGGVYYHHHTTHGKKYVHFGLTFTNKSGPLVTGVKTILQSLGFKPKIVKNERMYIYDFGEIQKYFKIIGSSNKKHTERLKDYIRNYKNKS